MNTATPHSSVGMQNLSDEHDRPVARAQYPGFFHQLPVIILTAAIVIGGVAWMRDLDAIQRATDLESIRTQNEALRAEGADNRRQIEATTKLLKDAIGRHDGEVFRTDEEVQKLNAERIAQLADSIAQKVIPALPTPKSPAEAEQLQADQVDKVAARLTDNLHPLLASAAADQKAASAQVIQQYEARVQQMDRNLQVTQTAAQDALKLTHEISALYLDSFKDKGMLVRLVALPANLLMDAANLDLVTSRDRAKVQAELSAKMNELDQRLRSVPTAALADKS